MNAPARIIHVDELCRRLRELAGALREQGFSHESCSPRDVDDAVAVIQHYDEETGRLERSAVRGFERGASRP